MRRSSGVKHHPKRLINSKALLHGETGLPRSFPNELSVSHILPVRARKTVSEITGGKENAHMTDTFHLALVFFSPHVSLTCFNLEVTEAPADLLCSFSLLLRSVLFPVPSRCLFLCSRTHTANIPSALICSKSIKTPASYRSR